MRTGSPPASETARSYCGIARSAYSESTECGMGMAMRGAIVLMIGSRPHPLELSQIFILAIAADFPDQREHEHNSSGNQRYRHRYVPVRDPHVHRHAADRGHDSRPDDAKQQADGKGD